MSNDTTTVAELISSIDVAMQRMSTGNSHRAVLAAARVAILDLAARLSAHEQHLRTLAQSGAALFTPTVAPEIVKEVLADL